MLIPRFSLRHLLIITTASAIFFYVVAMATRGYQWAIVVSIAGSSILLALIVYAVLFAIAWLLTLVGGVFTKRHVAASPFANAAPPPQFITPPEDPE